MAIKLDQREYRNLQIEMRADNPDVETEPDYKVEGYASTYEPYLLYKDGENEIYERIAPTAFDESDLSDVVFLYNHEGMVYARQKNGTLEISVDEKGLHTVADLSSTEASKQIYESIRSGLIDQMSFAFVVEEDSVEEDEETPGHFTRTITKIGKVYDVSAVSIPANPDTDISAVSARDYFHGVMEARTAERLEREKRVRLAKLKFNALSME